MDSPRRGSFFRLRRWLLLPLFVIGSYSLLFTRTRVGSMLAHFLSTHTGEPSPGFWLHAIYGLAALIGLRAFRRTWGSAYLGAKVVKDKQLHTDQLAEDGPFLRTRSPLYLGNLLMI